MAVEPIITDQKEYEEYQRALQEEEAEAIAHPKPTTMYESPIGPERPPSFREKVESRAKDIKESIKRAPTRTYEKIKSGIGGIKKHYEEEVEYERKRAKTEREYKSSPEYIAHKAEHELKMEEMSARRQPSRRGSTMATPSLITMGNYKPAYSGKSTVPRAVFGGGYQPAYNGQMMSMETPRVVKAPIVKAPVKHTIKTQPIKITSFGSGAMPKIGTFGSSIPKIGGGGKKIETPKIGSGLFNSIPKIGKTITHKGSIKSIDIKTNIGIIGEVPKIGLGLKKKPIKHKTKRSRKR